MLEAIQDQQQLLGPQKVNQLLHLQGAARRPEVQPSGQRVHQSLCRRRPGQGHEPHAVVPEGSLLGGGLQRQARLAAATGTVQGEQPPIPAGQRVGELLALGFPPDERRGRCRQQGGRGAGVHVGQRAGLDLLHQGQGFVFGLESQLVRQRLAKGPVVLQSGVATIAQRQSAQQQLLSSFVPGVQVQQPPGVAARRFGLSTR